MRQLSVCRDFKSKLTKNDSIEFVPVNDICHVMKAAIGNKHQAIIKIVKKLDQELMTRNITDKPIEQVDLCELAVTEATKSINLENCIDLLSFADHNIVDELKINCLKFIMLNLVSFFSEGTKFSD